MTQMQWHRLLSAERCGGIEPTDTLEIGRTPFHKDQDKIIFSSAFRRLDRKTQVHPLNENDHIHTRLTHSLEVSCIGRSLGTRVGQGLQSSLPKQITPADVGAIVQAACLAHDIGNPPYGHSGEDAIRQWLQDTHNAHLLEGLSALERIDLQTFEGNAQGFRLVTQVESHRFQGGMRLTNATLGTFLKYPWTVDYVHNKQKHKFACYQSELPILQALAHNLGLIEQTKNCFARHPLVYLLEAADDICYGLIDLEDGIEMGLISYIELENLLKPLFDKQWQDVLTQLKQTDNERRRLQLLRGLAMEVLVTQVSQCFILHETLLLSGQLQGEIIDYCDEPIKQVVHAAKILAKERIFKDQRKLIIEIGAYSTLGTLLDAFLTAVRETVTQGQPTYRNKRLLELMGRSAPDSSWSLYQAYMRALDFIAGMTDNYAADLAKQFSGYQPMD